MPTNATMVAHTAQDNSPHDDDARVNTTQEPDTNLPNTGPTTNTESGEEETTQAETAQAVTSLARTTGFRRKREASPPRPAGVEIVYVREYPALCSTDRDPPQNKPRISLETIIKNSDLFSEVDPTSTLALARYIALPAIKSYPAAKLLFPNVYEDRAAGGKGLMEEEWEELVQWAAEGLNQMREGGGTEIYKACMPNPNSFLPKLSQERDDAMQLTLLNRLPQQRD